MLKAKRSFFRGVSKCLENSGQLYVHHTVAEIGKDSSAVAMGLVHFIRKLKPGIGFFRPIDNTSVEGERAKLVNGVFHLDDELRSMQGLTQVRASDLLSQNNFDDMLEEIYTAYRSYKVHHDFVVIEGTSLKSYGNDTDTLNARIAAALDAFGFLVTDADLVAQGSENGDLKVLAREIAKCAKLSSLAFEDNNVEVRSSIVHHSIPAIGRTQNDLADMFREFQLPFAGAICLDSVLQSVQVMDLVRALKAEVMYDVEVEPLLARVAECFVATQQTEAVLNHEWKKGTAVITTADRTDLVARIIKSKTAAKNIVAVIITEGGMVTEESVMLSEKRKIPMLSTRMTCFEAAASIAKIKPCIELGSVQKIARAKELFDKYINSDLLKEATLKEMKAPINPFMFKNSILEEARQNKRTILLPEGEEPRILQAADFILKHGICDIIFLGSSERILQTAKEHQAELNSARIIDPAHCSDMDMDKYADIYFLARKHKGVTLERARETVLNDPTVFGTCMVAAGDADGMVSGAVHTTANTIRPALQMIKTQPSTPIVSSIFFICLRDKVLVYGDVAINVNPSSDQLATIAIASADTASAFGLEPRVALLSYATGDSNAGPEIQKVSDAVAIAKQRRPDLLIEGPLQYDAAVNPEVARTKLKGKESEVAGKATVLIFPDLNSSNISCKAVQQSTGAVAIGPILQGLKKPVNDLSRGCTVKDIISTIAATAVQASHLLKSS